MTDSELGEFNVGDAPQSMAVYVCPDCGRANIGANDCPQCGSEICRMGLAAKPTHYVRAEIVASSREAALLEAAQAVCIYCLEVVPLANADEMQFDSFGENFGIGWIHTKTLKATVFKHRCQAGAIHDLRAKKEQNDA